MFINIFLAGGGLVFVGFLRVLVLSGLTVLGFSGLKGLGLEVEGSLQGFRASMRKLARNVGCTDVDPMSP